ncbi:hypothetical protein KCU64_g20897, partial [Aureobasidium melanogenum]
MARITYTNQYDTYDCSIANKASKSAPGDLGNTNITVRLENKAAELTIVAINLIFFDKISFTAAKSIDLAWNILAGRGFQVLAAF